MLCGLCLVRFQSSCGLGVGRGRAAGVGVLVSIWAVIVFCGDGGGDTGG